MKNYSRRVNRKMTRYRTPSTFLVRRAEAAKRQPLQVPPAHGRKNRRPGRGRKVGGPSVNFLLARRG